MEVKTQKIRSLPVMFQNLVLTVHIMIFPLSLNMATKISNSSTKVVIFQIKYLALLIGHPMFNNKVE